MSNSTPVYNKTMYEALAMKAIEIQVGDLVKIYASVADVMEIIGCDAKCGDKFLCGHAKKIPLLLQSCTWISMLLQTGSMVLSAHTRSNESIL